MPHARYFDGQHAMATAVELQVAGDELLLLGHEQTIRVPLAQVRISEAMGGAERFMYLGEAGHCEIPAQPDLAAFLAQHPHLSSSSTGLVARLQQRWAIAAVSLAVVFLAAAGTYQWGLPALSNWLAWHLPPSTLKELGDETLALLDKKFLQPSRLPHSRQEQLVQEMSKLRLPDGQPFNADIQFRDSPHIGANAFALPNGQIVVTDQLVKLAANDEEIEAVLAHETGHLSRRHSLRILIRGSLTAALLTWYLGDFSNLAATIPASLLQARYSREYETEADDYAAAMLHANGIAPVRLAEMLQRLEKSYSGSGSDSSYLDSHPATADRIARLSQQ